MLSKSDNNENDSEESKIRELSEKHRKSNSKAIRMGNLSLITLISALCKK